MRRLTAVVGSAPIALPVSPRPPQQITGAIPGTLHDASGVAVLTTGFPLALPSSGYTARTLPDAGGPGRRRYNLARGRRTAVHERVSLAIRAEAFHLPTTPFFLPPATRLGPASLGVIHQAVGKRQMPFSLRRIL